MDEAKAPTVEQARQMTLGTQALEFRAAQDDAGRYAWIGAMLQRLKVPRPFACVPQSLNAGRRGPFVPGERPDGHARAWSARCDSICDMRRAPHGGAEPCAFETGRQRIVVPALTASRPQEAVRRDTALQKGIEPILHTRRQHGSGAGTRRPLSGFQSCRVMMTRSTEPSRSRCSAGRSRSIGCRGSVALPFSRGPATMTLLRASLAMMRWSGQHDITAISQPTARKLRSCSSGRRLCRRFRLSRPLRRAYSVTAVVSPVRRL
jgi:hypothetical protein